MTQFKSGEGVSNKTRAYLAYVLRDRDYFPDFIRNYLLNNFVAFFRGDILFDKATGNTNTNLLFVVVDINGSWNDKLQKYHSVERGRKQFYDFMKLWNEKNINTYKVWDYVVEDLHLSHYHVFVLDISPFENTIAEFDKGNYSKMFTDEELKKYNITKIKNGKPSILYATLKKLPEAKEVFKNRIKKEFGTILTEDIDVEEYDIPPFKRNEIMNYEKKD
jgi:hypothetical protein